MVEAAGEKLVRADEAAEGGSNNVTVAVRVKPLSANETACMTVTGRTVCLAMPKGDQMFHFDHAYDATAEQQSVYDEVGAPILRKALQGYNATIFAYGQTGSGKTHSMMGTADDGGLIPRLSDELFSVIESAKREAPNKRFLVTCSFMEIYNEVLHDLLQARHAGGGRAKGPSAKENSRETLKEALEIKEHPSLGVHVKGLLELPVSSRLQLEKLMAQGNGRRAVGETNMNARSSRSHSIFSIRIVQQDEIEGSENGEKRELWSKINLVDLAGSERASKTGAEGARLKEGININQSLSALGNVIIALAEASRKGKKVFVPYRNSKLTRVLQESLGGNALTSMVATVSQSSAHVEESLSTLQYADRAKSIALRATRNEQVSEVGRLREEVEGLRRKLAEGGAREGSSEEEMLRRKIEEYEARLQQTFEEKERACAALVEREAEMRRSVAKQHAQRRAQQSGSGAQWLSLLWAGSTAWRGPFLSSMATLQNGQHDADRKLERATAYIALLVQTVREAMQQLAALPSSNPNGDATATATASATATSAASAASAASAPSLPPRLVECHGALQLTRHLTLRLASLREQLSEASRLRAAASACCVKVIDALGAQRKAQAATTTATTEAHEAEEAAYDMAAVEEKVVRRQQELRADAESSLVNACVAETARVVAAALAGEWEAMAMAMVTGNDASESARDAFVQLQGSTSEALTKLRALERLQTSHRAKVVQADGDGADRDVDASLPESESADAEQSLQQAMETLSVFEACLSHRILNPPKPKAVVAEALTVVVGEATGMMQPGQPGVSEIDEEQVADMRAQIAELKKQNEQLMTVVTCQATSIAQVTAGNGQSSAREKQQLEALAAQAAQLNELQAQLEAARAVRGAHATGSAAGSARELEAERRIAELDEMRAQQAAQLELGEKLLADHSEQLRKESERAAAAEQAAAEAEAKAEELAEALREMSAHAEGQAAELAQARQAEERFAELAGHMGCVDDDGQLMEAQLNELTKQLMEARSAEAAYQEWLLDVKQMMASGHEEGLAMALGQSMWEVRRKEQELAKKDAEIKSLRAERGRSRAAIAQGAAADAPAPAAAALLTRHHPLRPKYTSPPTTADTARGETERATVERPPASAPANVRGGPAVHGRIVPPAMRGGSGGGVGGVGCSGCGSRMPELTSLAGAPAGSSKLAPLAAGAISLHGALSDDDLDPANHAEPAPVSRWQKMTAVRTARAGGESVAGGAAWAAAAAIRSSNASSAEGACGSRGGRAARGGRRGGAAGRGGRGCGGGDGVGGRGGCGGVGGAGGGSGGGAGDGLGGGDGVGGVSAARVGHAARARLGSRGISDR